MRIVVNFQKGYSRIPPYFLASFIFNTIIVGFCIERFCCLRNLEDKTLKKHWSILLRPRMVIVRCCGSTSSGRFLALLYKLCFASDSPVVLSPRCSRAYAPCCLVLQTNGYLEENELTVFSTKCWTNEISLREGCGFQLVI